MLTCRLPPTARSLEAGQVKGRGTEVSVNAPRPRAAPRWFAPCWPRPEEVHRPSVARDHPGPLPVLMDVPWKHLTVEG
jgi:hypothetical protein